ncbi:MAG: LON peptidase substrate-binding domain-containing protein [Rhodospirillaceae bacterium]
MKVPIFPLSTVLFPDGILRLRVFEQRYLEMTKQCLCDESPFGVCLIKEGSEVGTPAVPEAVGCLATIIQWDMQQLGVFALTARGGARFRILDQSVDRLGLITAQVETWDPDPPDATMISACRDLIAALIERAGPELFPKPLQLDDATWVAYRLAELLPMREQEKQELLELRDAGERLQRVARRLADEGYTG